MAAQGHEKRIARIYYRELFAALALYTVLLLAAITAGLSFSYGFLETAAYPKLSMFAVWAVLCLSVGAVQCARKLLDR